MSDAAPARVFSPEIWSQRILGVSWGRTVLALSAAL